MYRVFNNGELNMHAELARMIITTVLKVPKGKVVTYGQIAAMAGLPRHARFVGYVLKGMDDTTEVPWHRVINSQGKISLSKLDNHGMNLQASLLMQEGVVVAGGKVDLKRFQWRP